MSIFVAWPTAHFHHDGRVNSMIPLVAGKWLHSLRVRGCPVPGTTVLLCCRRFGTTIRVCLTKYTHRNNKSIRYRSATVDTGVRCMTRWIGIERWSESWNVFFLLWLTCVRSYYCTLWYFFVDVNLTRGSWATSPTCLGAGRPQYLATKRRVRTFETGPALN